MNHEKLLLECSTPSPPGWFELVVGLPKEARLLDPRIIVEHGSTDHDVVEHILPPLAARSARHVFRADRPIQRICLGYEIEDHLEPPTLQCRLRRLSLAARATEAVRRSPREALAVAGWRLVGKRVRARNRLTRILGNLPQTSYSAWLAEREPEWAREIETIARRIRADRASGPRFTIAVDVAGRSRISACTLASLSRQGCPDVELLVLVSSPEAVERPRQLPTGWVWRFVDIAKQPSRPQRLQAALAAASAPWLLSINDGDMLADGAIVRLVAAAMEAPGAVALYGDHDMLSDQGRRRKPAFKPEWNEPYFLAHDYIGRSVAFATHTARPAGGFRAEYPGEETGDLLLRLVRGSRAGGPAPVASVQRIVLHAASTSADADRRSRSASTRARMVLDHLQALGRSARANPDRLGHVRVTWPVPDPAPRVSLIVPTRDRIDLLRPCIEGLRHETDYPALEILIADNGSERTETKAYFASLTVDARVRIVPVPGPFNFSAINNRAVEAAEGDIIGFINNDIEVLEPGWLREMVGYAVQENCGAVGAKLLYQTGTVQHAGVVMGLGGLAGHVHRFYPADHPGYACRLQVPQHFSAVTAACLLVERRKFVTVGGFDEIAFPVAFNDVDLCLKLGRCGWSNVWTPYAVLRHKESASRVHDMSSERRAAWDIECAHLRERWGAFIRRDPCYNENLTREREDFTL
ncbi:MAG: glycosyltransferase [Hyphomicrobiaceae bacterium]|nr:glycosyltransferase [Hyphomicrobiaceae bacterium]